MIVFAGLAFGLLANRLLRPRSSGDDRDAGHALNELMTPLETLAVLLLAFVLVVAAQSFDAAERAAQEEARAVDSLYEVASYAPEPQQRELQSSIICYIRAVRSLEWPIMTRGEISAVADGWTDGFTDIFAELQSEPYFRLLVRADQERSSARSARLVHAQPSVPTYVYWFMALVLAVTVFGFAFTIPRRRAVFHVATLVVLAGLFATSLVLIRDVDRPFTGLVRVNSRALATVQRHVTELYVETYGALRLPCDQQGRPVQQ